MPPPGWGAGGFGAPPPRPGSANFVGPMPFGGQIGNQGGGANPWQVRTPPLQSLTSGSYTMSPSFGGSRGGGGGGGMGGGGGGGMMGPMGPPPPNPMAGWAASQLYGQMEQQRQAANAANEGRYTLMNSMYGRLHRDSMSDVGRMSGQERADLNRRYDQMGASQQQSLTDRGLGNTTIVNNMMQGNLAERQSSLNRLRDQEIQRRIGTRLETMSPWMGMIERRTDAAPDQGMMAQLAMQAGQAGVPVNYGGGQAAPQYGGGYTNPFLARRMGYR